MPLLAPAAPIDSCFWLPRLTACTWVQRLGVYTVQVSVGAAGGRFGAELGRVAGAFGLGWVAVLGLACGFGLGLAWGLAVGFA